MKQVAADAFQREESPTAASATKKLFVTSGEIRYLVVLQGNGGQRGVIVDASTGDGAADLALARNPGNKVVYVGPASDAVPVLETVG